MIADLEPYTEYRDTGLPWIPRIPSHWDMRRSKYLFREVDQRSVAGTELRLSMSQRLGLVPSSEIKERRLVSESNVGGKLCEPGDLVLNRLKAHLGVLALSPMSGLVSPDYTVFRPIGTANHRYFCAVYRSPYCGQELRKRAKGIVEGFWRLYTDDFYDIQVPLPPPEEQAAIVRFLDWANGRLERAIRAKRKVIALLNEQKQAIIHRAVTRGLAPFAPLQSAESLWFPKLPAGWKVLSLRRVITSAVDGPHFSPQYQDTGIPFLSARNVRADRWILSNAKYISDADYIEFSRRVRPEVGDVLYTKGGTTGVARAVDLTFPFQVWVHIAVLKLKRDRVIPEFLAYCLNSPRCYEQAQLFTRGATNQDLGLGRMKDIELTVPPTLEEQNAIVDFLNSECSAFSNAVARLECEIKLLGEYRSRLTADVVTGKLDVREAAARLPDEAPLDSFGNDTDLDDEAEDIGEEVAE